MKAVVATFNQEKALVGAFSVITNLRMELFEALLDTRHLYPGFSERSVSAMAAHSCDPAPLTAWHCRGPAFTTLSVMSNELTLVLFGSIFTSIQSDKTRCKRKEWIGYLTYSEKGHKMYLKWVIQLRWVWRGKSRTSSWWYCGVEGSVMMTSRAQHHCDQQHVSGEKL